MFIVGFLAQYAGQYGIKPRVIKGSGVGAFQSEDLVSREGACGRFETTPSWDKVGVRGHRLCTGQALTS